MAAAGWQEALSIPLAIAAGALAGAGWIVGLWLTRHPLLQEMMWLGAKVRPNRAEACQFQNRLSRSVRFTQGFNINARG